jgi:rare lipoprotein A
MQTVPLGAGGAIPRPFLYGAGARGRRLLAVLVGLGTLSTALPAVAGSAIPSLMTGHASWYGDRFADRPTASGERYDPDKLTGAHRTLPLGSKVRVTNLLNGRSVLVTITDRGPYARRRAIDLSYGAARVLGMIRRGVTRVRIELVES